MVLRLPRTVLALLSGGGGSLSLSLSLSFGALATSGTAAAAVLATREDVDDGKEIFTELVCFSDGSRWVVFNHDTRAVELEHVLDEVEGEPRESVAVGNHKRAEAALTRESKNAAQAGALPVETGADVLDDVGSRHAGVKLDESGALACEVAALLGRRDAAVEVGALES